MLSTLIKKNYKKCIGILVSLCIILTMIPLNPMTAFGATSESNLSVSIDKTEAKVGETVTITISNKDMTVQSFTGGIKFDKDKFDCISIKNIDKESINPAEEIYGYVTSKKGNKKPLEVSSIKDANREGTVGFALTGTTDISYNQGVVLYATFRCKAVGTGNYVLYEDTSGMCEYRNDSIVQKTVTIPKASNDVSITENPGKTYDGTSVTASATATNAAGVISYKYYDDAACSSEIVAPKDAGTYYVKAFVAEDSNYEPAESEAVQFIISPAKATYEVPSTATTYIGQAMPTTVNVNAAGVNSEMPEITITYYTDNACTAPASGNFTKTGSKTLYYKASTTNKNYDVSDIKGSVVYTVSALPQQVIDSAFSNPVNAKYGDDLAAKTATVTSENPGAVTYSSSNADIATVDALTGKVTIKKAGTVTITATAAAVADKWSETKVSYTLTIAPKDITVNVVSTAVTYGSAVPDFSISETGTISGTPDTYNDLGLVLTTTATSSSPVGTYDVTGTASNKNYNVTINGTQRFTINPADYTVNVDTTQTIKVGSGLSAITVTNGVQGEGVNNEVVNGSFAWYSNEECTTPAIDADLSSLAVDATKTLYWKFTTTAGNYVTTPKTGNTTFTIVEGDPQTLTFAQNVITATYGDTNVGQIATNDRTDGGAISYASSATDVAVVDADGNVTILKPGEVTITATAAAVPGKYAKGTKSYTLQISRKQVNVTAGTYSVTKVYDKTTTAGIASGELEVIGILAADSTVTVVPATGEYTSPDAGNSNVTVGLSLFGDTDGKYELAESSVSVPASISPKPVTISGITAENKVYDGNTTASVITSGATFGGIIAGDVLTVSTTGTFDNKNVGSNKTVTFGMLVLDGDSAANYIIATSGNQTDTTAEITRKPVTVSGITAADKEYDRDTTATVDTSNANFDGIVAGDVLTVSTNGTFEDKNVGASKTVTLGTLVLGGESEANYTLAADGNQVSATAAITAKEVTVASGITASDKDYDGNTDAVLACDSAVITGTISGDTVTVSAKGTFENANAGEEKTVKISEIRLEGTDAGNYTLAASGNQATAIATIHKATITLSGITLSASSFTYDGNAKVVTLVGLPDTVKATYENNSKTYAGTYTATPTFVYDETNYVLVSTAVPEMTFTISPADQVPAITTSAYAKAGKTVDLAALVSNAQGEVTFEGANVTDTTLTVPEDAATDATYTATVKIAAKDVDGDGTADFKAYTDTTITVTVVEKNVPTITVDNITSTYNGTAVTLNGKATFEGQDIEGTFAFKDNATPTNVADSRTYTVVFTPTDDTEYVAVEKVILVTINKAIPAVTVTAGSVSTAGKTLADSALSVSGEVKGTVSWDAPEDTEIQQGTAYGWTFTPTDTANYEVKTGNATPWAAPSYIGGGGLPAAPDKLKPGKAGAIEEIAKVAAANVYEADEQKDVNQIVKAAEEKINAATTAEEIEAIKREATEAIEKILTAADKDLIRTIESINMENGFKAKSKIIMLKNKTAIKITWTVPSDLEFDGFDIFKSTKRYSGFGKEPYFSTKKRSYINTKELKPGNTYYYKVRACKIIKGEEYYTGWSTKAFRTIK